MLKRFERVRNLRRPALRRRADILGGFLLKEGRRLTGSITAALPMAERRRRARRIGSLSAAAVAAAGVAAVGGLLLWDDRRRAAMRQRLAGITGSAAASADRASEPVQMSAGQR
jgi:hypothetical protein